jgi:hypothetical protein
MIKESVSSTSLSSIRVEVCKNYQGKTPFAGHGLRAHICHAEINTMKTLKSLTLAASLGAIFMSSALALPSWKGGSALEIIQKKSDVEKLEPKSQLVLVCKSSNTITIIDIKNEKQARKLCAEGTMIECKDCKKHYKVVWKNSPGKTSSPELKMDIVNAKGESCMFLARVK